MAKKKMADLEDLDMDLDLDEETEDQDIDVDEDGEDEDDEEPVVASKKKVAPAAPVKKVAPAAPVKKVAPAAPVKKVAPAAPVKKGFAIPKKTAAPKKNAIDLSSGIVKATEFSMVLKEKLTKDYPNITLADAERFRAAFIETGEYLISEKCSFSLFFKKRVKIIEVGDRIYDPIEGKTTFHTLVPAHFEASFKTKTEGIENIKGSINAKGKFVPATEEPAPVKKGAPAPIKKKK
jgi:hypothetical protein